MLLGNVERPWGADRRNGRWQQVCGIGGGKAALDWLGAMGHAVLHGPDIAAGEAAAERDIRSFAT
jgi:hypothetical protein